MSSQNKIIQSLFALASFLIAGAYALVLFYAPPEQTMGLVQKVFYFHMACAWIGMLAFLLAAIFGIAYLRRQNPRWDRFGASCVEIGLVFTLVTNFSGMIWAKAVWNTWWTWDPRLTTMTIMAFTYIAYLLLRRGMDDPAKRAQFGAIYAIIGFVTVPMTFFSARYLRTIHPILFGSGAERMALSPKMLHTMAASLLAFTVLFAALLLYRECLMSQEEKLKALLASEEENHA
ncbi:MAG: cytochrome c biogenesis protein CcsA [Anaerolineaceae bacterium]|nr:cytochrome c biogenesis protein CcsA [Anaerolineaceae bacterium]